MVFAQECGPGTGRIPGGGGQRHVRGLQHCDPGPAPGREHRPGTGHHDDGIRTKPLHKFLCTLASLLEHRVSANFGLNVRSG